MRQFDLEKAKSGAPLVTRDGRQVKFIAHVPEAAEGARVVFLYDDRTIGWRYEDGRTVRFDDYQCDLFLADPPKVKRSWFTGVLLEISAYKHSQRVAGETKEDAIKGWNMNVWKLVSEHTHTWEEDAP